MTFSESVSPVAPSDFALTGTATGGSVTQVTGGPQIYTVEATTGGSTPSATLGLDVSDADNSIKDPAGNQLTPSTFAGGAGAQFTIDKVAPTLSTLKMLDPNNDGVVERVDATFSETLDGASASVSGWTTATNQPTGISLNTVTQSSSAVLALNFTGGHRGRQEHHGRTDGRQTGATASLRKMPGLDCRRKSESTSPATCTPSAVRLHRRRRKRGQ